MENPATEQLKQLEQEYLEKRAALEQQTGGDEQSAEAESLPSEHETLSQVVEGTIQQHVPGFQASSHVAASDDDALPADQQAAVQGWVATVFSHGIAQGIKAAKDSNDLALIDAFHSALTGELYRVLVEQKKLEEVK